MKAIDTRKVRHGLTKLGLMRKRRGNGTGHEIWTDSQGNEFRPLMKKKEIKIASLYALGEALEGKGICTRRDFLVQLSSH